MGEDRIVKIALGQMKVFQGDTEKNLKKILDLTDQAAAQNADIICFPELAYCGYFLESEELQRLAQPQDGPFVQTLREKAKSAGIHIIAGYAEAGEIPGIMYNSCIFIDDQGEIIGNMRKVNAWGQEKLKFREGREFPVIQTKFGKVGMLICYDVEFPEPSRIEALKGAEIVFCTGGMSVDPDDKTPLAIKNTGARIVSYGSPVLPGAMFLLSYYDAGDRLVPICGLPGCAMYNKRTIFDIVLPRLMARDMIYADELAGLGEGGLCLNCDVCTFPNCGFGKGF